MRAEPSSCSPARHIRHAALYGTVLLTPVLYLPELHLDYGSPMPDFSKLVSGRGGGWLPDPVTSIQIEDRVSWRGLHENVFLLKLARPRFHLFAVGMAMVTLVGCSQLRWNPTDGAR